MSVQLLSILVLAAVFVIATITSANMGGLAFAAAFLVGTFPGHLSTDDVIAGFPADIFLVLVGVTYLFAIARANGTIDWVVHQAVRMVRGRLVFLPWVMALLAALIPAIGAPVPAAVAIVAPIAMGMAARYEISKLLLGAMIVHGTLAGGFSPLSVYGVIVNGVMRRNNLGGAELPLFLANLVTNVVLMSIAFVVLGGLKLAAAQRERDRVTVGSGQSDVDGAETEPAAPEAPFTAEVLATLLGLVTMVVLILVNDDLNLGLIAISISVLLGLFAPKAQQRVVTQIAWPTVLLITGVLTYIGVLDRLGTIDYVSDAVQKVGAPAVGALLLCYIGAIVSAFASSTGLMGSLIPLAIPFMVEGGIGTAAMVAAVTITATVVDISPFSTSGAIILANAPEQERDTFYRGLVRYGAVMVVCSPPICWLIFILPT